MRQRKPQPEWKQKLSHGLAAIVIAIKGWDKLEHGGTGFAVILFFLAGLVLLYVALHHRLHHASFAPHLEVGMFLVEACVMATVAAFYFHEEKKALPWVYVLVTLMYVGLALRQMRLNARPGSKAESL